MLLAGRGHRGRSVALGQHDQRPARRLEPRPRRSPSGPPWSGPNEPDGVPCRRLGRPGVVDGVVAQVRGHRLARRPAVRRSWRARCPGPRPAGRSARAGSCTGYRDSSARISLIGRFRSIAHDLAVGLGRRRSSGRYCAGSVSSCSRNTPSGGDLRQRLPVGRAGDRDRDRAGRAVPGQPDHPHVVAEVLAAELRADADASG